MSKPSHRPILVWSIIVALVCLAALSIDSFFHSTTLRIPRGGTNPPAFAYLEGGVMHLDWETTPAPFEERTLAFIRRPLKYPISPWSSEHLLPKFYEKEDSYKYEGATPAARKVAQAAGIRSPFIQYRMALPLWMLITCLAGLGFWIYRRHLRRMAKEEWELSQKEAAAS